MTPATQKSPLDFVVMVRQAHHERHCILSLSKDHRTKRGCIH